MLDFMRSSTRPTSSTAIHHHHQQPPPHMAIHAHQAKPTALQMHSRHHQHHNYCRQHVSSQPTSLQQKNRAKSVPNLDIAEVPHWVTDRQSGVTYAVGHLLGRGGFAKCFLACSDRQYFALKVISRDSFKRQSQQLSKIRREIQTHFSLRHPNIVCLYSTFECAQNIYMLLELCPNRTLAELIDQSQGRCLPEPNAIVFMKQLLLAMRYLHDDCMLVHRDIKPGNVLLSREWTVKLADFGFCCSIDALANRPAHTICGTPNYVAPEVIDKKGHSIYSDCWALGCTFYSMLFGRPPFHSENLQQIYARVRRSDYIFPEQFNVSEAAKDFIRRILILRPEYRPRVCDMLCHIAQNPRPSFDRSLSQLSNNGHGDGGAMHFNDSGPGLSRIQLNAHSPSFSPGIGNIAATCSTTFGGKQTEPLAIEDFKFKNSFLPTMDYSSTFIPANGENLETIIDPPHWDRTPTNPSTAAKTITTIFGGADSGLGGSGSADLSNGTGSPLGKIVQFTLDKYIQALQSVMDSFNPQNLIPIGAPTVDILPTSFIAKWVDYTNKFGFGVTLRDGTRSILFNDHSSLSSTHDQRHFSFHANKLGNEPCLEWSYSEGFPSSDICHKISCMSILRDYMDRELYSSIPIAQNQRPSNEIVTMDLLRRNRNSSGKRQTSRLVHIIDFRKFPNALFMFLSDGTCQVNFSDSHHKLAMSMVPSHGEPDGISYQLHLITGGKDRRYFSYQTESNFEFEQKASPLSDNGWSLVRGYQRVLQSYQHHLLNRNSLVYSTYC